VKDEVYSNRVDMLDELKAVTVNVKKGKLNVSGKRWTS
jgi:hypothetical protein